MAQHHLWLAQAQHDSGNFSARELERMEGLLARAAQKSVTMFNPFTGEIRRFNSNGEIERPTTTFLGGCGGIREF